ncbi:MAG: hypothetical protein ACREV5_23120 [Steroidobacter sp.]
MAKVAQGGVMRGYLFDAAAKRFVAADGSQRTDASLRGLAATSGQEVTYTCAPWGSGPRMALSL